MTPVVIPPKIFTPSLRTTELANKLCGWLDATTSYDVDLKEGLDRSHGNYAGVPKWRHCYGRRFVLVDDEKSIKDADGKATGKTIETHLIAGDQLCMPGHIIKTGNGRQYMVQPSGALRRI